MRLQKEKGNSEYLSSATRRWRQRRLLHDEIGDPDEYLVGFTHGQRSRLT